MYYILDPAIALRSWRFVPYAYYAKGIETACGLKKEEFELLLKFDGQTDLLESELLKGLLRQKLGRACEKGERSLTPWQKYRDCDNRYFPKVNWMITEKCNYNCLHCFNAADNSRSFGEWSLEEAEDFIEQLQNCGVQSVMITGGEPMIHPHFMEIIRSIYAHGMVLVELNTNGHFLTQNILDEFKRIGCSPRMKLSFDGVGYHDWMRNHKGAEEKAIQAIRLCVENGFSVVINSNVNRKNIQAVNRTIELLDYLGVQCTRLIRTTEAPRWAQNAAGETLTMQEYYDYMLGLLEAYQKEKHQMSLDIWQFMSYDPQSRIYQLGTIKCSAETYRDSLPVCVGNRSMIAVGANGNVYPCHQMSGYYNAAGVILGDVKQDGLQKILQGGDYIKQVCATVGEVAEHDEKCRTCEHFQYCCGGCRAIALATTGDYLAADPSKCFFWKNGYGEKIKQMMEGD